MFMRAVRVNAKRLRADLFFESSLRHYLPEYALGTWEVGGPTTHVRDVAGVEPEDFLTIARRYVTGPESRRPPEPHRPNLGLHVDRARADAPPGSVRSTPAASPARPSPVFGRIGRLANEHTASADPTHERFGAIRSRRRYRFPMPVGPTIVVLAACAATARPLANPITALD